MQHRSHDAGSLAGRGDRDNDENSPSEPMSRAALNLGTSGLATACGPKSPQRVCEQQRVGHFEPDLGQPQRPVLVNQVIWLIRRTLTNVDEKQRVQRMVLRKRDPVKRPSLEDHRVGCQRTEFRQLALIRLEGVITPLMEQFLYRKLATLAPDNAEITERLGRFEKKP